MRARRIPCAIIRGGTSKGIFFHERDLPAIPSERERLLLSVFGSPDPRQIDGLGGADPLTSKLAIVKPSTRSDADVEYTFGQVSIEEASIDYSLTCGNLCAGAAIFAVDEGLAPVQGPVTTLRIFNTNTGTHLRARVPVEDGRAATHGSFSIDGVPGKSALIELTFLRVAGAATGALLPSGNRIDRLKLPGGRLLEVSIVDAGNPYVFVSAEGFGLRGDESPAELESNRELIALAQEVLQQGSLLVNQVARPLQPIAIKKLAIVAPTHAGADFQARIISANGKAHKAYAVTGAICAASAAFIRETVVQRLLTRVPDGRVRIRHPEGLIELGLECEERDGWTQPVGATLARTARRIMDGFVYLGARAEPEQDARASCG